MGVLDAWVYGPGQWKNLRTGLVKAVEGATLAYDWSDDNLPWAYTSTAQFTADWPSGVTIVDIQTGSSDFYTNLQNTVNAAGARCVVRLGEGVYSLKSFRLIGSSGDPTYSFGFWFPNLQGFLGQGADKTFVQMDANSMTTAQLDKMKTMVRADFAPIQMGLCRFDGKADTPVILAGLTFRAADQQMLTSVWPDVGVVTPQPAPHNGVILYSGSPSFVSYTRFQAAGRAITSAPPFETANIGTQYSTHYWHHNEFDGRRSAALDPARPRRCGPLMVNNEVVHHMSDCWLHHSNVSRYAANDENRETTGQYTVLRCKADHITDNQNRDPALNGGNSLGGYTNATPFGWESVSGTITVEDSIIQQDNPLASGQVPMHLQLTSTGSRNPQGGRMYVKGGLFRNAGHPVLDGFVCVRIQASTHWWTDGFDTTLDVRLESGTRLTPYVVAGSFPPASLPSNVKPTTHYLIRQA